MKILEIESCDKCPYVSVGSMYSDVQYCDRSMGKKLLAEHKIQKWCPLPDASQPTAALDEKPSQVS